MRLIQALLISAIISVSAQAQSVTSPPPPAPSASPPETAEPKFALAGKRSILREFYAVQMNCDPVDWLELSIVTKPSHGIAEIATRETQMLFLDPNPRKSCTGKPVQAKVVTYRPNADFEGSDSLVVEMINSEGGAGRYRLNIAVRRSGGL